MKTSIARWQAKLCLSTQQFRHWPDRDQPFDITKSEIIQHLIADPDFLAWAFEQAKPMMRFDTVTRLWTGLHSKAEAGRVDRSPDRVRIVPTPPKFTVDGYAAAREKIGPLTRATEKEFAVAVGCSTATVWRLHSAWKQLEKLRAETKA